MFKLTIVVLVTLVVCGNASKLPKDGRSSSFTQCIEEQDKAIMDINTKYNQAMTKCYNQYDEDVSKVDQEFTADRQQVERDTDVTIGELNSCKLHRRNDDFFNCYVNAVSFKYSLFRIIWNSLRLLEY